MNDLDFSSREFFKSRLGFILVSAGCAIGLGNVWKFPYMCGQNGGAIFIIIYLIFLAILGLPVMIAEFAVGRGSRASSAKSFERLEPAGTQWHNYGRFALCGNYLLLMFYTVVCGWIFYFTYKSACGDFTRERLAASAFEGQFSEMLSSAGTQIFWMVAAVALAAIVCILGIRKGVERVSKIMMSALLVLMVLLAINSMTLENAGAGLKFFFLPNVETVREVGIFNVIFAALAQAFFTLSIGIGSMAIFGSYFDKKNSIAGEACIITALDTFVAIVSGLIVIPACFAFGVRPDAGPPLIFITLPNIFNQMLGGHIWGTVFFIFLSAAAASTVIAVFENVVANGMDLFGWSRKKSTILSAGTLAILSLPCVFGYAFWTHFEPLGAGTSVLDLEDFLVCNNLLPLGSLIYILFCTRKNGWGWRGFLAEVNAGTGLRLAHGFRIYFSYILPLIIVAVYLKGYWDKFAPLGTAALAGWMTFALALLACVAFLATRKPRERKNGK